MSERDVDIEENRLRGVVDELVAVSDPEWQRENWSDLYQILPSYVETMSQLFDSIQALELLEHPLLRFGIWEELQIRLLALLRDLEAYFHAHNEWVIASTLWADKKWRNLASRTRDIIAELREVDGLRDIFTQIDADNASLRND